MIISRSGSPHGKGLIVYFTDDAKGRYNYSGSWIDAEPHGEGKYRYRETLINTYFLNQIISGTTIFRNGNTHVGNYQNGLAQGRGIMK